MILLRRLRKVFNLDSKREFSYLLMELSVLLSRSLSRQRLTVNPLVSSALESEAAAISTSLKGLQTLVVVLLHLQKTMIRT